MMRRFPTPDRPTLQPMRRKTTNRPLPKVSNIAQTVSQTSFPESILLAVTGMSPGVLTETVWALAHEPEPVIPTRVIILTTAAGREEIRRQLFAPSAQLGGAEAWQALRTALEAAGHNLRGLLRFGTTPDDLRVITSSEAGSGRSTELSDIRTPADNTAAANFFLEQVRGIVENPDTRLIVSIAGGRKTMGALLYACMTLVGRETDRLTHVLVNEPFEAQRGFFFPDQPGGPLLARDGAALDPRVAQIELADVPFVPLRNLFTRELGRKAGTFSNLVATCRENIRQRAAEHLRLEVEIQRPEIHVNGQRQTLAPLEHLLLLFLARRAKQHEPAYCSYAEAIDDLNAFRADLRTTAPANKFGDWRHADSLRAAWDEQEIRKATSGIRTKLQRLGGDAALLAPCLPEKGRCSLLLTGPLIHIKS